MKIKNFFSPKTRPKPRRVRLSARGVLRSLFSRVPSNKVAADISSLAPEVIPAARVQRYPSPIDDVDSVLELGFSRYSSTENEVELPRLETRTTHLVKKWRDNSGVVETMHGTTVPYEIEIESVTPPAVYKEGKEKKERSKNKSKKSKRKNEKAQGNSSYNNFVKVLPINFEELKNDGVSLPVIGAKMTLKGDGAYQQNAASGGINAAPASDFNIPRSSCMGGPWSNNIPRPTPLSRFSRLSTIERMEKRRDTSNQIEEQNRTIDELQKEQLKIRSSLFDINSRLNRARRELPKATDFMYSYKIDLEITQLDIERTNIIEKLSKNRMEINVRIDKVKQLTNLIARLRVRGAVFNESEDTVKDGRPIGAHYGRVRSTVENMQCYVPYSYSQKEDSDSDSEDDRIERKSMSIRKVLMHTQDEDPADPYDRRVKRLPPIQRF